jgi:hypothetical protein
MDDICVINRKSIPYLEMKPQLSKCVTCLRRAILIGFEAVLMHDPVGLVAVGSPALVVHQRLPHADQLPLLVGVDWLVPAGGLPKPGQGGPVRPCPGRVFLVLVAEEVVFVLFLLTRSSQSALLCNLISFEQC